MGLFSKAIALENEETPTTGTHPGLLNRATSSEPAETKAPIATPRLKKKVRMLRRTTTRRSRRNR
jgi:hypothetical protein